VEDGEEDVKDCEERDYIPLIRGIRKHNMTVMYIWTRKEAALFFTGVCKAFRERGDLGGADFYLEITLVWSDEAAEHDDGSFVFVQSLGPADYARIVGNVMPARPRHGRLGSCILDSHDRM
jgi:hypothetical protein